MTSKLVGFIAAVALTAAASAGTGLVIRSIQWMPVSTSRAGLPDANQKIRKALADVPLATESKLTSEALLTAIDKADKAIQQIYESMGHPVRVEHEMQQMRPKSSIEVRFRVIELSTDQH